MKSKSSFGSMVIVFTTQFCTFNMKVYVTELTVAGYLAEITSTLIKCETASESVVCDDVT
jgi:hypothetical protein